MRASFKLMAEAIDDNALPIIDRGNETTENLANVGQSISSAGQLRRAFDELRSFQRVLCLHRQYVASDRRRLRILRRAVTVLES
jgi:hypothetical protein